MKLSRTKEYQFSWLAAIPLLDVIFLLIFFLVLSSNFILQPGISVSVPLSRFTLGPQINPQIISITGGAAPAIYFRDQKVALDQLGPLLDEAKKEGRPIIIKADR
ncbi:MAG TPA: biopolymer transporter ExbD, partial [Chthoniobacterales bacterium]|nr:biopolymer transporter ExbD [Chthoniobacterales bacterium]